MFDKCFDKLEGAAGKKLGKEDKAKLRRGYESLVMQEMKAGDKPAADAMQIAFNRMVADAEKAKALAEFRKDMNTVKLSNLMADIDQVAGNIGGNKLEAIDRIMMWHPDNKTAMRSIDKHSEAIYQSHSKELRFISDALGSRMAGIFQRGDKVEIFTKHLYGEKVTHGDYPDIGVDEMASLKKASELWANMAERSRVRANKAGADIGKLDSWAYPQKWDAYMVMQRCKKLNKAKPQDAYIAIMKPRLDRLKMVDEFDSPLDDESIDALLREAYLSITTEGANKQGQALTRRGGSVANRGSQERVMHFKSAADYLEVQGMFGNQQLLQILDGHMRGAASQIAMLERLGPSPASNLDKAIASITEDRARSQADTKGDAYRIKMIQSELKILSGTANTMQHLGRARVFQGIRNLQTVRLAGATIASLAGDPAQYRMQMILHAWDTNMPLQRRLGHVLQRQLQGSVDLTKAMVSGGYRDAVMNMGLASEAMNNALYRAGEDMATAGWTSVMPSLVMRASGLGHLTDARRDAMRVMTMGAVADKLKYGFNELGDIDTKLIKGAGITEFDWKIYQAAKLDTTLGKAVLTPDAVMAVEGFSSIEITRAAENLSAFMLAEDKLNVLEPGMRQQAEKLAVLHNGEIARGNIRDELTLNFMQFKSFPHAYMSNYLKRMQMFDGPMGKSAYMGGMLVMATIGGAMVNQIWNMLSGRDIESMDPRKNPFFIGRSLLRGGGLGFYGDFLQTEVNWQGQAGLQAMLGPATGQFLLMAGTVAMALRDAASAGFEASTGIDTIDSDQAEKKWSRQIDAHVRDVKGLMPTNLWYTRALTDRLIYNQIGETLRPGYAERMQDRAKKTFGAEYFWNPGDVSDIRAPEIGGEISGGAL